MDGTARKKNKWKKGRRWWKSKEELVKARYTITRVQRKSKDEKKEERKGEVKKEDHNSFQHIEVEYLKDGEKNIAFFPRGGCEKIRCREKQKKKNEGGEGKGVDDGLQAKANARQGKMNKRDRDAGTRVRFWTSTSLCKTVGCACGSVVQRLTEERGKGDRVVCLGTIC